MLHHRPVCFSTLECNEIKHMNTLHARDGQKDGLTVYRRETTGDADIMLCSVCWVSSWRGCVSVTAGFLCSNQPRSEAVAPSHLSLHVMVIMMLLGRLEEDGSACLYTSAARRRQGGGGTRWSDDCAGRPIDVDLFFSPFLQTLLRVRPKPAAKLHYMKVKDAYK